MFFQHTLKKKAINISFKAIKKRKLGSNKNNTKYLENILLKLNINFIEENMVF